MDRRPAGAACDGTVIAVEYPVPRSEPNVSTEIAKKPAPTAANAQHPIILRAARHVTARLARAMRSLMVNLFMCRYEEDGPIALQGNFSSGELRYDRSSQPKFPK